MMTSSIALEGDQEYGLIVQQRGKAQQILFKYLVMVLNYQYGLSIVTAENLNEAAAILRRNTQQIHCLFIIQNEKVQNKMFLYALSLQGKIPLFFLCPFALHGLQAKVVEGMSNIILCAWERAFQKTKNSLGNLLAENLRADGLSKILQESGEVPYEQLQTQVEKRVKGLQTLPAIPEIVLRIMRLVSDPDCDIETLEQLLLNDPAIVQKLLQVVGSPLFGGAAHTGKWTLKEAIMRLGLKKAGALAQQVKMMNTFVKPEDSMFDLRRFWEHSIGCAMLADKLCTEKLISLKTEISFDTYWISAILHDIGKMILGFFFWDHFQNVVSQMAEAEEGMLTFRQAEAQLGDTVNHEQVGQLLMMKSNARKELVEAVRSHNSLGESPDELTCLINLADNLSKDLGLGYLPEEQGLYSEPLLNALQLSEEDIQSLKEKLDEEMVAEIKKVVAACLS